MDDLDLARRAARDWQRPPVSDLARKTWPLMVNRRDGKTEAEAYLGMFQGHVSTTRRVLVSGARGHGGY